MPCSKYKGKQRRLCFATKGFKDWSKIKRKRGLALASKRTRIRVAKKGGKTRRKKK